MLKSACVVAGLAVAASAQAQYISGFESLNSNAQGVVLTGQDGYYIPAGTTSTDFEVFNYAANSYSLPANPTGGDRFIAGTGEAGSPLSFERAQRDMQYGNGKGKWTMGFDIAAAFTGTLPSAQNLGSVSVQPFPGSQSFIALARWTDPAAAANWNADFVWFDAAGTQLTETVPNPGFQNLDIRKWYRWEIDFNLDTNAITEVRLTDIVAGTTVSQAIVDRYMEGGTAGSATPTGFRFFAGGSVAGNTLAFDNMSVVPAPGALVLLGLGGLTAIRRRR